MFELESVPQLGSRIASFGVTVSFFIFISFSQTINVKKEDKKKRNGFIDERRELRASRLSCEFIIFVHGRVESSTRREISE